MVEVGSGTDGRDGRIRHKGLTMAMRRAQMDYNSTESPSVTLKRPCADHAFNVNVNRRTGKCGRS